VGGICAIIRDLALAGQLITNGGTHGGTQDCRAELDDIATAASGRACPLVAMYAPCQRTRPDRKFSERSAAAGCAKAERGPDSEARAADRGGEDGAAENGDTPQLPVKVPGVALPAVKPRAETSKREKLDANADRGWMSRGRSSICRLPSPI